jgi:hypothetical protein
LENVTLTARQEEFEAAKGVFRIRISKTDRQNNGQKTDKTMAKRQTKQWPKDRQNNGQKKKYKNIKQRSTKHTHKTKDRVTQTPLKTGVNSGHPEG